MGAGKSASFKGDAKLARVKLRGWKLLYDCTPRIEFVADGLEAKGTTRYLFLDGTVRVDDLGSGKTVLCRDQYGKACRAVVPDGTRWYFNEEP